MIQCKNCKFYVGEDEEKNYSDREWPWNASLASTPPGMGTCLRIKMNPDNDAVIDMAIVQDGSGYFSVLRTKPEFGCTLGEKKNESSST